MSAQLHIQESFGFEKPARVERDEATGAITINRVKYLGPLSSNKDADGIQNAYPLKTRRESEGKYQGASVYLNHVDRADPGKERGYEEKLGRLWGPFEHTEEGSFASLKLNPKHPVAEQVAWDAEHSPDSLGLSHSAIGSGVVEGKTRQIKIEHVRSVDLVAAPATCSSLFESKQEAPMSEPKTADVVEVAEAAAETKPSAVDHLVESLKAENDSLKAQVEALETEKAETARLIAREKLITESNLPAEALSDIFVEQVKGAKDDETASALLEDRRRFCLNQTPESAAPVSTPTNEKSDEDFVNFLRS